jgi:ATPase subunit of ABC transporter with duplicated ATPase domains
LSHRFEDKVLFDNAELQVNNYEHIGVVGLNGAGKSTFMRILCGEVIQDEGSVRWLKGISHAYLDQHADIDRSLTCMEYLRSGFADLFAENGRMEGLYAEMTTVTDDRTLTRLSEKTQAIMDRLDDAGFFALDSRIKKVANGLGINDVGYDTVIATLSGGQRGKLMLAKLLLSEPDIMLLDEPTNFLDTAHISWLSDYLKSVKNAFILISHDTEFLNGVCNFIVSLSNRKIKKYTGNYTAFLKQSEMAERQYADDYESQQREIKKLEDYIARNKVRAATAAMAQSRQKKLDKIEVLGKPTGIVKTAFAFPYVMIAAENLLTVDKLSIGYDFPLLPPISFLFKNGERLWLKGANGIGKTTLVKTVTGNKEPLSGRYAYDINARYGYIEQEMSMSGGSNAVLCVQEACPKLSQAKIRGELGKVGLRQELQLRAVQHLSGGEQMRIKMCILMQKPTNILILDEPTNHLDVYAKAALQEALAAYEGSVILVSHEIPFANAVCNNMLDLEKK